MKIKKYRVGIDVGGTKICSVLWDGKRVIKACKFKTPKNLTAFKKLLGGILKSYRAKKAGIGVPGIISGNKIVFCPNIKYLKNYDISKLFKNAQIKSDNDARCFGRAEYLLGAGKGAKIGLFLTLGTGIGRAVGKNGKILNIKKFEYPEQWEKEYQKICDSRNNKKLAEFLGKKLGSIINPYRPQTIVAGGGVATRKGFLKLLQKALSIPVKKPKLGKNAAAIGAALSAA